MSLDSKRRASILLDQTIRASERWRQRSGQHVSEAAEPPTRIRLFEAREAKHAARKRAAAEIGEEMFERQIGPTLDFDDIAPDLAAYRAGLPVARIVLMPQSAEFQPKGFGSGFLIAPGVLITNNHVLPDREWASSSGAQFRYEKAEEGVRRGELFELDPDRFFLTNEDLDYTVVAVKPISHEGANLTGYGLEPLIEAQGKILKGQRVQIIQHPSGGTKKFAVRENHLVDLLDSYLHYTTDTKRGSSGSPVSNIHWEVVGLHHSAVGPMRDGRVITRDGQFYDPHTMDDSAVDWIANEGIRASVIVQSLRTARASLAAGKAAILDSVLAHTVDPLESGANFNSTGTIANMSQNNFSFTGPVTIYVGGSASAPVVSTTPPVPPLENREAVSVDPDYASRKGFDPNFLGSALPLPQLSPANQATASIELKYHHFSVVMNKGRRLAFYTAVNIRGDQSRRPTRSGDAWYFDPRLDREFQIGEFLYARNPLDRGHLVRRLDPAWGTTRVAKLANDDTFHFTNCSPQHATLNQGIWNELEDYLLDNADQANLRLIIFTGPVFKSDDPTYRQVQLPRQYWKVAVMTRADGSLLGVGFLQSQARMIRGLRESEFLAEEVRSDQVAISELEALIGMSFGLPSGSDPMEAAPAGPHESLGGMRVRRLQSADDIKLK